MIKLNLGCGSDLLDGFINLDISPDVGADVVHDLDVAPWPFEDDSIGQIAAIDVFEHVNDAVLFMRESHRILQPGGEILIKTPHWKHRDAYTDPTHKRFPTEHTFDYWIEGTLLNKLHGRAYGGFLFKQEKHISIINGAVIAQLWKP